jgi:hypothetical protein
LLNVRIQKLKIPVTAMVLPLVAGVLVGEGLFRFQRSESCLTFVNRSITPLLEPLKSVQIAKLACVIFATTVLSHISLTIVAKSLKERVTFISMPLQLIASALGAYRYSIPLLLGTVVYLSRRDAIILFIRQFEGFYELFEQINVFFLHSLSDPDQLIEKAQQELREGLSGIYESTQFILFANEPEVISTISQEINIFEKHLRSLATKIPLFEKKLETVQQLLRKTQQDLMLEISNIEHQSEELDQLFSEMDAEYSSFWEEMYKQLLGYQSLVNKQKEFQEKLVTLRDLAKKVELIISGIDLVNQSDGEEIRAIKRWNIYITHTSLPFLEDLFLLAWDTPSLGRKMVNEIFFGETEGSEDLISYQRRRIKLNEILPEGVSKFSQALILFKQARKSILDGLIRLEVTEPLDKEHWDAEEELLKQGRRFFTDGDLIFCATLFRSHLVGQAASTFLEYERRTPHP